MIYYFYGPDSYRRNQRLNFSIAEYKKKHPTADLAVFDLEERAEDWIKARDFLNQPSMFVDSKVLVLKNSNEVSGTGEGKEWIKVLKSNLETPHTFILISDVKKPLKAFEFLLEPPVKKDFFGELEGRLLEAFLKKEADARGLEFDKGSLNFLLDRFASAEERSWTIVSELEKISLSGFAEPVRLDDLKKVISWDSSDEVFGVAREIVRSRSREEKMMLLEKLLLQKKEPAYIFNSLAYIARGMDLVKLADYDVAVKSGNMEYEEALLDFAL